MGHLPGVVHIVLDGLGYCGTLWLFLAQICAISIVIKCLEDWLLNVRV
jgi:hypothetical protein